MGLPFCLSTRYTLLNTEIASAQDCKVEDALSLKQEWVNYTYLKDSPYLVRYWQGSFSKTYQFGRTYLRQLVDQCRGTILSETTVQHLGQKEMFRFVINNPNLNPNLASTIELLPLTEKEAEAALAAKQVECQNFSPL